MRRGPALALSLISLGASACVHARNFQSPAERITSSTAYAEAQRVRVDAGVLVPDTQSLALDLGVTVAPLPQRWDLRLNLAHAAAGILSAQSKFTVYDGRWYALGGRVGLSYVNPRALWVLPRELREELGQFQLTSVPLELWSSFPLTGHFGFDLGLRYRATVLTGTYDSDALLADANASRRGLTLQPMLDFYIAQRLAIRAGASLPLYTQLAEATAAEYEIEEDVIAGVRSVEWVRGSFANNVELHFLLETRFGRNTYTALGVNVWSFRPLAVLVVSPSLNMYWRF